MLLFWLSATLLVAQAALAFIVGYLLLLTTAAWRAARHTPPRPGDPTHHFAILIPAHNEALLLPETLASLDALDYPRDLYEVHVVADNCTDQTAAVARKLGATVHERQNPAERGKGYALQWLLARIWQEPAGPAADAFVIVDADTVVAPGFLRVMDARLAGGERVIQGYYAVRDPGRGTAVSLRYAAMAVLHFLRPQGRMVLGGSAGLKGNGMVFAAEVMQAHRWPASITEDIELHMDLILAGERVTFAPDALVWAEMPDTLAEAQTQNERWERGRVELARRYVPRLLHEARGAAQQGRRGRAFLLFDAALEHLIPPFSLLAALSGVGLLLAGLLAVPGRGRRKRACLPGVNLLLGVALLAGQAIYLLAGLRLVRAPRQVYQSLLAAPRYVLWKLLLYLGVLSGRGKDDWVRTARKEPLSESSLPVE